MGFSFKAVCYSNVGDAVHAFSHQFVYVSSDQVGRPVVSSVVSVDAVSLVQSVSIGGGVPVSFTHLSPSFESCQHSGGPDMVLEYFSLAMGFLIVIWASKVIYNLVRGRHDVA